MKRTFKLTIANPNVLHSYKIYGSTDGYVSVLATVTPTDVTINGTTVYLTNAEVGTDLLFKVSIFYDGFESLKSNIIDSTLSDIDYNFNSADRNRIPLEITIDWTKNISYETQFRLTAQEGTNAYMGIHSSSGINFYFGRVSGLFYGVVSSLGGNLGDTFNLSTTYKYKMVYTASDHISRHYVDDVLTGTSSAHADWGSVDVVYPIGKYSNTTLNSDGDWEVDYFNMTIDGVDYNFDFDEVINDKVGDSNGNDYVLDIL